MSPFTAKAQQLFAAVKTGDPIPRLDRSVDAESLWPTSLEKEADKSASILRSFFCDGFIVPYRTLAVCEQQIVRKCHGLAVFHLLRDGLRSPVASGSGILVTRLPDGKWSAPSAILIDSKPSLSRGVDVLDVVLVINDKHGMDTLLDSVVALQKCIDVAPGPIPRSETIQYQSPYNPPTHASVWSYAKSKGEIIDIDLSHLVIRESTNENERFYGITGLSGREILSGHAKTPSGISDHLFNTINALDNQSNNLSGLPKPGKCPGDRKIKAPSNGI